MDIKHEYRLQNNEGHMVAESSTTLEAFIAGPWKRLGTRTLLNEMMLVLFN